MLARRLLAFAACLLVAGAIAASLAPPDLRRDSRARDAATIAEPKPPPTQTQPTGRSQPQATAGPGDANGPSPPTGVAVRINVPHLPDDLPRPRVELGDLVALSVEVPGPTTVTVEGLDRFEAADATSPARFEFFARRAGTFAIRLADGSRAGELVVTDPNADANPRGS